MKYDVKMSRRCVVTMQFEVEIKLGAWGDALGFVVADKV